MRKLKPVLRWWKIFSRFYCNLRDNCLRFDKLREKFSSCKRFNNDSKRLLIVLNEKLKWKINFLLFMSFKILVITFHCFFVKLFFCDQIFLWAIGEFLSFLSFKLKICVVKILFFIVFWGRSGQNKAVNTFLHFI